MSLQVVPRPASGYRRTRWKNGGGWTTEVAVEPVDAYLSTGFDWRISIAEIEQDGPFSRFPGIERDLFLLGGAGMDLTIDGQVVRVDQPLQRVHFSGDSPVDCRLIDGPTRDFNVMATASHTLAFISGQPVSQPLAVAGPAGSQWLIHALDAPLVIDVDGVRHHADAGDSLQLDCRNEAGGFVIVRSGELILVRFTPRNANAS